MTHFGHFRENKCIPKIISCKNIEKLMRAFQENCVINGKTDERMDRAKLLEPYLKVEVQIEIS